jgi:NACalpha-BTF3-like transcription factor
MIKYLSSILLFSVNITTLPLQIPQINNPEMVIICMDDHSAEEHRVPHKITDEEVGADDNEIEVSNQSNKCNSKVQLALAALGSSIVTAIVTLTIHFTKK